MILAILIATPIFAWWLFPSAATRYYDRVLGSNAAYLANAITGHNIMLMRWADQPGTISVFEPELGGGLGQREAVTVIRADRIRAFIPWLLGLALVWPLGVACGAAGGRALLARAWRRVLLVFAAIVLLFITHIGTFAVQVAEAYADGNTALGLAAWSAGSRSAWSTVSWFLLLIGGPCFPVLIVAWLARFLRRNDA